MQHEISFEVDRPIDAVRKEVIEYFEKQDFKVDQSASRTLSINRGSIVGNMFAFNPLKWKSEISIVFEEKSVSAKFNINTIHQTVTPREEQLWSAFINNFKKSIETGQSTIAQNSEELTKTYHSTLKYIGTALIGAVIFGVPGGVIAYFTGINAIASSAAVAGALVFINRQIKKEKRQGYDK